MRHLACRLVGFGTYSETTTRSVSPAVEESVTRTWCDRCGKRLRGSP